MAWIEHGFMAILGLIALWILLSGLDDLFITLVFLWTRRGRFRWPDPAELDACSERRIAILVPLWHEDGVIGQMLDRNLAALRYRNYDVFVGVYPNDEPTVRAVAEAAARHPRVHLAMGPQNGPSSKGDNLNSVYAFIRRFEQIHDCHFDIMMTHDAEDLIHPDSLRMINWLSRDYAMVQVPVLALPTRVREFTHGLYCDEFGEYQQKDIPARQLLGGFLPSNGVGTGFERGALEHLAATRGGRIFDPECLTEDYENGYALHALGYPQIFVPLRFSPEGLLATREYFPRHWRAAVRQRSRWVAGIALQGWERHGWRAPWKQLYWFWRDRKGLVGSLLSPVANLALAYGAASWALAGRNGQVWQLGRAMPPWLCVCCSVTMAISVVQLAVRVWLSARIYGWKFAAAAPLRLPWGNLVNFAATVKAIDQFLRARWHRRALAWAKTEHVYLAAGSKAPGQPRLGEVLVRMHSITLRDLEDALGACPSHVRIGEYLMRNRGLASERLYQALSTQTGIPLGIPANLRVSQSATRILPADAVRRWKVLPYRVTAGQLHVVTSDIPSAAMIRELAGISTLELRFRLVQPEYFEALAEAYLPPEPSAMAVSQFESPRRFAEPVPPGRAVRPFG
jgi:bacteriophage N4 adsorption protein B